MPSSAHLRVLPFKSHVCQENTVRRICYAGIDVSRYYLQETEAQCASFGLTPYVDAGPPRKYRAICVVDRTDYGDLLANSPAQAAKKPWWKVW